MTIKAALLPHLTELTGAPLTHLEFARRLSALDDFDVLFVVPDDGPLALRAREYGLDVHVVSSPTGGIAARRGPLCKLRHVLRRRAARKALVRFFRERKPDIVFASSVVNATPALAAKAAGAKLVYHLQEPDFSFPDTPRNRRKAQTISAASDLLFNAPGAHVEMFPGANMLAVHNGVETGRFDRTRRGACRRALLDEFQLPDDAEIAVCIASVTVRKGIDLLLEAALLLREKRPRLRTLVVGPDGGNKAFADGIRARAAAEFPAGTFLLPGPRNEVPDLLLGADLFVLPTRADAQPLAVIEAMAAGLPIVTTSAGNMPEVLREGEIGSILKNPTPEDLAREIDGVLASPEIRARYTAGALARAQDYTYDAAVEIVARELRRIAAP